MSMDRSVVDADHCLHFNILHFYLFQEFFLNVMLRYEIGLTIYETISKRAHLSV